MQLEERLKTCCRCGETKPVSCFGPKKKKNRSIPRGHCRACDNRRCQNWSHRNPEKNRRKYYNWRAKKLIHSLLCSAKQRAKKRNLAFEITADEIRNTRHCPICRVEFSDLRMLDTKRAYQPTIRSLDRVVNEDGYVTGNVVIICRSCNRLKSNGTAAQHLRIAKFIRHHQRRQASTDYSELEP